MKFPFLCPTLFWVFRARCAQGDDDNGVRAPLADYTVLSYCRDIVLLNCNIDVTIVARTMQRRKTDLPLARNDNADPNDNVSVTERLPMNLQGRVARRSSAKSGSLVFLLIAAILIAVVALMSPGSIKVVERKIAKDVYRAEQQVEDWFQPRRPVVEDRMAADFDASAAMKRQPSNWVDGEKKLKAKLKVLAERQSQGHDLTVPILTRFLGDDFPAWVEKGDGEEAWKKKRDEKYEEMRKEEIIWKANANKALG